MNNISEKMHKFAPAVLRIGMALVFLWFGTQQIFFTDMWTSLIPQWIMNLSGMSAVTLVHFNGAFEIVFGICLLAGYFTQVTALFLALHMFHIAFTVGYSSIGIRDIGLAIATTSVFLHGADFWCIDRFWDGKIG
jgi:uncharacterized membrane protein YphA (DoxX/SURF4 family)